MRYLKMTMVHLPKIKTRLTVDRDNHGIQNFKINRIKATSWLLWAFLVLDFSYSQKLNEFRSPCIRFDLINTLWYLTLNALCRQPNQIIIQGTQELRLRLNLIDLIDPIEITCMLQHAQSGTTFGYKFSATVSLASVHRKFSSGSIFDHSRV